MKFLIGLLLFMIGAAAVFFVLSTESALLTHPEGTIARSELELIATNFLLMLLVMVPTYLALIFIIWKYRAGNHTEKEYDPEHRSGIVSELLMWLVPASVISVMAFITWEATYALDPYKPIESDTQPLTIQVIAMDWKWLFIYPEQGIATLNFVQIPEKTPIRFELAADGSPMNSFWIPQLSGQIYAMTGMVTPLHLIADKIGSYTGRAAEINGDGYADMTFDVKSSTKTEFEDWISNVKKSKEKLDNSVYAELIKPSKKLPLTLYSSVKNDLFNRVVMKYMMHTH